MNHTKCSPTWGLNPKRSRKQFEKFPHQWKNGTLISQPDSYKYDFFPAFSLGYLHYRYVSHLFENDRNFTYLSEMEREMSFRTEMGFYYSYFKTMVEERPFIAAISKLMYDRLVEFPKDINAVNRFNIHPEVSS